MTNSKQSPFVILDFGDLGIDVHKTDIIQLENRNSLNNESFDFEHPQVKVRIAKTKGAKKKEEYDVVVIKFGVLLNGAMVKKKTVDAWGFGDVIQYKLSDDNDTFIAFKTIETKLIKYENSKEELQPFLLRALDGKPIDGKSTPLGKGKRIKTSKRNWTSDNDSSADDAEGTSTTPKKNAKKKKVQMERAVAKDMVAKLVEEKKSAQVKQIKTSVAISESSESDEEEELRYYKPTRDELQMQLQAKMRENKDLRQEVSTLRQLLVVVEDVPKVLNEMKEVLTAMKRAIPAKTSLPSLTPTLSTMKPKANSLFAPKTDKINISKEELEILQCENILKPDGEVVVGKEQLVLLNHSTPRKLMNDLLIACFDSETLKTSSLTGTICNIQKMKSVAPKKALCPEKVKLLQAYVLKVFSGVTVAELNTFIREKLVNESRPSKAKPKM